MTVVHYFGQHHLENSSVIVTRLYLPFSLFIRAYYKCNNKQLIRFTTPGFFARHLLNDIRTGDVCTGHWKSGNWAPGLNLAIQWVTREVPLIKISDSRERNVNNSNEFTGLLFEKFCNHNIRILSDLIEVNGHLVSDSHVILSLSLSVGTGQLRSKKVCALIIVVSHY